MAKPPPNLDLLLSSRNQPFFCLNVFLFFLAGGNFNWLMSSEIINDFSFSPARIDFFFFFVETVGYEGFYKFMNVLITVGRWLLPAFSISNKLKKKTKTFVKSERVCSVTPLITYVFHFVYCPARQSV